jgi:hypothetical protein
MMKILQVLLHLALSAFEVICYGTFTILGAINEREQVASTGGLLVGSLGISAAFNRHTSGGLMGATSARQSVQSLLHISSVLDRSHQHSASLLHLWKDKSSVPARALVFSPPRPFCLRMLSLSGFRFVCGRERYGFLLICDHPLAPPISCVRLE